MESPRHRNIACDLASTDWSKAADYARPIDDPRGACQALAWCARFAPQPDSERLIDQAFRKAEDVQDAYWRVVVPAWPLRALVELEHHARAEREFERIAPLAPRVEPPASRSEACFLVYQALAFAVNETSRRALRWVLSESQPAQHWRQKRNVRNAVIQAVSIHLVEREDALSLVQNESLKSTIVRRLDAGEIFFPRPFFWIVAGASPAA